MAKKSIAWILVLAVGKTGVCQSGVKPSIGLLYMVGKVSLLAFQIDQPHPNLNFWREICPPSVNYPNP